MNISEKITELINNQTTELTDEQVQTCIDFLTDVDFIPTEKTE